MTRRKKPAPVEYTTIELTVPVADLERWREYATKRYAGDFNDFACDAFENQLASDWENAAANEKLDAAIAKAIAGGHVPKSKPKRRGAA